MYIFIYKKRIKHKNVHVFSLFNFFSLEKKVIKNSKNY